MASIDRSTWGRMEFLEQFHIIQCVSFIRFIRTIGGIKRCITASIDESMTDIGAKAMRIVWADRAEDAFYRDEQEAGKWV